MQDCFFHDAHAALTHGEVVVEVAGCLQEDNNDNTDNDDDENTDAEADKVEAVLQGASVQTMARLRTVIYGT
jgi:hypothetical protein